MILWADDITITVPQMPAFSKKDTMELLKRSNVHFTVYESNNILIRRFGDFAIKLFFNMRLGIKQIILKQQLSC